MIQLGYYSAQQTQDESMDFDPNYDPSDFLMKKESNTQVQAQVQQQQQYQENFDYSQAGIQEGAGGDEVSQNYYNNFNQQQFNMGDFAFQQPQEDFMQSQQQQQQQQQIIPPDGSALDDLDISESSDEDQNESNENAADTSKEDDGLWF